MATNRLFIKQMQSSLIDSWDEATKLLEQRCNHRQRSSEVLIMSKSLQPSVHPDYVLIHKKALLVNTFILAHTTRQLQSFVNLSTAVITQEFGNLARYEVGQMSSEEIDAVVQELLDNSDKRGFTIVTDTP
jgi:hypothetical protein